MLAVEVGDGSIGFERELVSLFDLFRGRFGFVVVRKKQMYYGDAEKAEELKTDGMIVYTCCLSTMDGGNNHVISVFDCLIFNNNYLNAIPLSLENLHLCSGLGEETIQYKTCSSIIEWKFDVTSGKDHNAKAKS